MVTNTLNWWFFTYISQRLGIALEALGTNWVLEGRGENSANEFWEVSLPSRSEWANFHHFAYSGSMEDYAYLQKQAVIKAWLNTTSLEFKKSILWRVGHEVQ